MTTNETSTTTDPEFDAMRSVYAALKDLDSEAQGRVLDYVLKRLGLDRGRPVPEPPGTSFSPVELAAEAKNSSGHQPPEQSEESDESLAGVSPVAQKWMRRNGLTTDQLSKVFSLGLDEIDLVARAVPGKTKKEKMRNVVLLVGTAAYLGTGAARTDYETLKEALGHYNAYDGTNYSSYMKDFAAEMSGSKDGGYTLTARGLAAAADLVKEITASQ